MRGARKALLLGALDDDLALEGRDALGDFTAVGPVVHKEQFNVFRRSDQKLSEAGREHVAGLVVLLVTDSGAGDDTAETTADRAVNTSGLAPVSLNTHN